MKASDKLKEERARIDIMLARGFHDVLKNDPNYLTDIAKKKFGIESTRDIDLENLQEQPDLLDVLRQAKEVRELVASELPDNFENSICSLQF